jgi:hypothetical protein
MKLCPLEIIPVCFLLDIDCYVYFRNVMFQESDHLNITVEWSSCFDSDSHSVKKFSLFNLFKDFMQIYAFFLGSSDGIFICHGIIFHLAPRHHTDKYLLELHHPPIQNIHHDFCF